MSDKTTGKNNRGARYERGMEKMTEMFGDFGAKTVESLEGSAPGLGRYLAEYVFGDVLSRPGLDLRSREIATVAALTAMGNAAPQLRAHIGAALNVGCSRQEIIEVMIQMTVYAGFPAALNGIQAAKEVFAEAFTEGPDEDEVEEDEVEDAPLDVSPEISDDTSEDLEERTAEDAAEE